MIIDSLAKRRAQTQAFNINFDEQLTSLPARLTALSATYTRATQKWVLQHATHATNIFSYSEDFSQAVWTKRGFTPTYNYGIAPDGTTTSTLITISATTVKDFYRSFSVASGAKYRPSVYIKRVSTTGVVRFSNPSGGNGRVNIDLATIGDDWVRVYYGCPEGTGQIEFEGYTTNAGGWILTSTTPDTQLEIWGGMCELGTTTNPYIKTVADPVTVYTPSASLNLVPLQSNVFGTTYDVATGKYAYLPEPAGTNRVSWTEGGVANWTVSNVVEGTPFFGRTNSLYFGDNSALRDAYKALSVTSGLAYTVSIFVKMTDGLAPVVGTSTTTGDFSLFSQANMHTSPALVTDCGGGVYRVSSSRTATATVSSSAGLYKFTGQSARTFEVTGIQVEVGTKATSYIYGTSGTTTRNKDDLGVLLSNVVGFNQTGYSMYSELRQDTPTHATSGEIFYVSDGTNTNRVFQRITNTNTYQQYIINSGATVGVSTVGSFGAVLAKFAASFTDNYTYACVNGVFTTPDTTCAMPTATMTLLNIGSNATNGSQTNAYIFRVQLIMKTLTREEAAVLTS